MRNERLLVAGAAALVLAGGIGYVATRGPVTTGHLAEQHLAAQQQTSKPVPPAVLTVTPADGAARVEPDAQVQITASGGTLTQVTVASRGSAVTGLYGPGGTSWSTEWGLKPATSYTVTAVAANSEGAAATEVTHFTTRSAARTLEIASITPDSGETVGVGMPIIVDFNYDVAHPDRAAVEHALEVSSDSPVTGAWFWASDSEVVFRPQSYWPAHEHVMLIAHLTGVPAGPGLWGVSDLSHSFTIGDSHVVKVNLGTDLARFYINGSLARKVPVSGGMGGFDSVGNDFYTTSGVHLTMGSYDSVWMTSPNIKAGRPGYYHELVYDDVQISDSGEYMHQSPGGLWCLGHENCSHGCVRMTAEDAAWWRHTAYRGDPVTITGTPRALAWDNGWGYWQQSWTTWLKGSSAGPVTTTTLAQASPAASAPASSTSPAASSTSAPPTTAGLVDLPCARRVEPVGLVGGVRRHGDLAGLGSADGCVQRRRRGRGVGRLADAFALQSQSSFLVHRARMASLWGARGGRGPSQRPRPPCHPAQESTQVDGGIPRRLASGVAT